MSDFSHNTTLLTRGLQTADFTYILPPERIAVRPLARRDYSRMLIADAPTQSIIHRHFYDLPELLPADALLITNATKVIAARLEARKPTGGAVEIFLLEPADAPSAAEGLVMRGSCRWRCLLGGRKLRTGIILSGGSSGVEFTAAIVSEEGVERVLEFQWHTGVTFGELIQRTGATPLPPYIKRRADAEDTERYQTVYAREEGAVAAPTAGLHFTPDVFAALESRGITRAEVVLAVGLGTFKPMEEEFVRDVVMHAEKIHITLTELRRITTHCTEKRPIVCVGTTSLRTIESLYWFGVELLEKRADTHLESFFVSQWTPYAERGYYPSAEEALGAVLQWANTNNLDEIRGATALMIAPGYRFGTAQGLLTNFHQPSSTLLLLVACFLGRNFWREVYHSALENDYRFLSYGDSSLLWRQNS